MPRGDRDFYDCARGRTDVVHEESFYSAVCPVFSRDCDIRTKYPSRISREELFHELYGALEPSCNYPDSRSELKLIRPSLEL